MDEKLTEQDNSPESLQEKKAWRPPHFRQQIRTWFGIGNVTLRDSLLRVAGHVAVLTVIAMGVWFARIGLDTLTADAAVPAETPVEAEDAPSSPEKALTLNDLPAYEPVRLGEGQVARASDMHTMFPERPRLEIIKYQVQQGDTLFGIAENFNIEPESILWGNFEILQDNPHNLSPGQELNIPPIDGTLYTWHEGDGLTGVAKFFGVEPAEILEWPGNELDPFMDPANPSIPAGMVLIVPGGTRELVTWSAPRISRANPGVAKILGPGACGSIYDGPIGTGSFAWPTSSHFLSGYDYSSVHPGIDIAGSTGNGIFAADSGVVVYAGWNDWGYGYVVVLDHGNGWQTLYGHLSQVNVGCGQAVFQGNVIGGMGCTGNCSGTHLHFEMMNDEFGKVNPWNFLP